MSQHPEVLAMMLCDMIITDVESSKKSLIGLFDRVESPAMPCLLNELHVYLCLTDGHGTLPVSISCIAADEGDTLTTNILINFGPTYASTLTFDMNNAATIAYSRAKIDAILDLHYETNQRGHR